MQRHCQVAVVCWLGELLQQARALKAPCRERRTGRRWVTCLNAVAAVLLMDGCSAMYCGDPYATGREKTPAWDRDGGRLSPNSDGGEECASLCRQVCLGPDSELLSCFTDVDAGLASCLCRRANHCQ